MRRFAIVGILAVVLLGGFLALGMFSPSPTEDDAPLMITMSGIPPEVSETATESEVASVPTSPPPEQEVAPATESAASAPTGPETVAEPSAEASNPQRAMTALRAEIGDAQQQAQSTQQSTRGLALSTVEQMIQDGAITPEALAQMDIPTGSIAAPSATTTAQPDSQASAPFDEALSIQPGTLLSIEDNPEPFASEEPPVIEDFDTPLEMVLEAPDEFESASDIPAEGEFEQLATMDVSATEEAAAAPVAEETISVEAASDAVGAEERAETNSEEVDALLEALEQGADLSELLPATAAGPPPSERIIPTHLFAAPGQFPPEGYLAYGVVAFPQNPTPDTEARFAMLCRAFQGIISSVAGATAAFPSARQVVTIWPVSRAEIANELNSSPNGQKCELAAKHYNLPHSDFFMDAARAAGENIGSDRGPFLLAWNPGHSIGTIGAPVLSKNLSLVVTKQQAEADFRAWKRKIAATCWDCPIYRYELRRTLRLYSDYHGARIIGAIRAMITDVLLGEGDSDDA
ncbi:hypothetical protein [Shimia sp. R9_3]|uniref:hypothetical protein n=1 Tax=Shimia sp. R9_3 TaxID=2821113 RepID=UPI001ADABFCC|nr:hypothetical protein [Shimia sp. R9_3]MBO9402069.1 hypothetical protein [Shimia sp. R9_3]